MIDATFLPGLSAVQGKAVVARFDGGRLSSERGMLALREIERRLDLADRLAGCLKDLRTPEKGGASLGRNHPVSHAHHGLMWEAWAPL